MDQKIKGQLAIIDSLLKSEAFSLSIAKTQDTAYYKGIGAPVRPFLSAAEDTALIKRTVKEEKIATNLAGFYAMECGLNLLCNQSTEKPTVWLQKIIDGKTDSATVLLLNRFANATWKISQPFRGADRITRLVFTGASFLPETEVKKDYAQVQRAAIKLFSSLQNMKDSTAARQLLTIRDLLHSQSYAMEIAAFMDAGYYEVKSKPAPAFLNTDEDTATTTKPAREIKVATNVAGFYALECCTNYLVTTRNILPSAVLVSIIDNSISREDKDLFSRFANATWKASQPFRGLNRIERETFTPFNFLSEADVEKDWVQIKAAAKRVLAELNDR